MTRYQLAKLVEWAGELRSRKRLQKVVYLLQAAGAPIEAEFTLHHYGPYSFDVAQLLPRLQPITKESQDEFRFYVPQAARSTAEKLRANWSSK